MGGSIILEYAFLDLYWGYISFLLLYELGGYQHNSEDWNKYTGPGAGFRFYLNNITQSAIGIDAAYNSLNNEFLFTFTMGVKR